MIIISLLIDAQDERDYYYGLIVAFAAGLNP